MEHLGFEEKKQALADAFARSAQSTYTRYGAPRYGHDYALAADGQSFYAHMQRDGSYSIRKDWERTVLEVVEAEFVKNKSEPQKIKAIANSCAELVLRP